MRDNLFTGQQAIDRQQQLLRHLLGQGPAPELEKSMDAGHSTGTDLTNQVSTGAATKTEDLDGHLHHLTGRPRKKKKKGPAAPGALADDGQPDELEKALGTLLGDELEKGRDLGRLTKKVITNSRGQKQTVYVRAGGDEPGSERPAAKPEQPAGDGGGAQHTPEQLQQFAQGTDTQKLLQHLAGEQGTPEQKRVATKVLQGRGVDVKAELQKLTGAGAAPDAKPQPAPAEQPQPAAAQPQAEQPQAPQVGMGNGAATPEVAALYKDWTTEQLHQVAGASTTPEPMRKAAKAVLAYRDQNPTPEPAPAKPEGQPAAAQAKPDAKTPKPDAKTAKPDAKTPKTSAKDDKQAPGTPADWQGDTSLPEQVRKSADLNVKGITKIADKLIHGNDVTGIIYGSGGAGKTYNVINELKKAGKKEIKLDDPSTHGGDYLKITGKITPKAVYETMYKFRDKLLIFDDCDSALANEDTVNMFKGALDTSDTRTVSRVTPEGRPASAAKKKPAEAFDQRNYDALRRKIGKGESLSPQEKKQYQQLRQQKQQPAQDAGKAQAEASEAQPLPNSFDFTGKILFITNKKPHGDALQPILSRGSDHDATMNKDEILYSMSRALPTIPVRAGADGKPPVVPFAERKEIYDFIKENVGLFGDLSMRDFSKVYEDKKYAERQGEDWKQEALGTLQAQARKAGIEKALEQLREPWDAIEKALESQLGLELGVLGLEQTQELEKGAKVPVGTITTLRDGRRTIKTERGWRIYYGKESKAWQEKKTIPTNFEVGGKKYHVGHTPGQDLKVTREDGRPYTKNSKALRAVVEAYKQEHLKDYQSPDFFQGHEGMSAEDMSLHIADTSHNPQEVALEWLAQDPDTMGYRDQMIMEHLRSTTMESFRRFGDKNQLAGTNIRRNYLKDDGTPLDVQAANISQTAGIEITEEDLVDFMLQFPGGQHTAKGSNPIRERLAQRFHYLTGFNPDEAFARQLNALDLVEQLSEQEQAAAWFMADDAPWTPEPAARLAHAPLDDDEVPF